MSPDRPDMPRVEASLNRLEQALIDEYLRARGCDAARLDALPPSERAAVLGDASTYASTKLTEIESRSRFLHELRDGGPHTGGTGLD